MAALSAWFWNERFWLPHNVTWADLADPAPGVEYPKAGHLLSALPLALGIFAVRIFFERSHVSSDRPSIVSKSEKPSSRVESAFLETTVLTSGLYYYYITELSFYWSLMFSQFTDIKRKDFLIMFVHHLATISLISFSYVNNMLRVGSLVMCVHDTSDFLLEAAKLANYAKYQRLCDFLFVVFGMIFFGTRLIIFPFWILNTTLFESWDIIGPYPSWWLFNVLLLVLQVLHVIWSYLIARIAFKAIMRGKVSKDERSDIESSSEEETETTPKERLKTTSPRGENGTNGHLGSKPWSQNHNNW
ncbi:ceramide synthase 5 [Garra rufa]|uniref:ceramide synthase 5 n=1 Tax=Garra rufa TaxID=137080 RepID=UPI003CCED5F1